MQQTMRDAHAAATATVKRMMLAGIPYATSVQVQAPQKPKKIPTAKQYSKMAIVYYDSNVLLKLLDFDLLAKKLRTGRNVQETE
jgi:hypothetical protein